MPWQPMSDVKSWVATHPLLLPLHGGRVWFRIPDSASTYPLCRIYRAGGGYQNIGAPLVDLRIGIDIWGAAAGSSEGTYDQTDQLTVATETALWQLDNALVGGSYLYGAQPSGSPFNPDPDDGAPRFTITATVTCGQAPITEGN